MACVCVRVLNRPLQRFCASRSGDSRPTLTGGRNLCPCAQEESSYANGKATHRIRVVPAANLTVTCSVSNRLGEDARTINVSSRRSNAAAAAAAAVTLALTTKP